jgi:hypothetical protein
MALLPRWQYMTDESKALVKRTDFASEASHTSHSQD